MIVGRRRGWNISGTRIIVDDAISWPISRIDQPPSIYAYALLRYITDVSERATHEVNPYRTISELPARDLLLEMAGFELITKEQFEELAAVK